MAICTSLWPQWQFCAWKGAHATSRGFFCRHSTIAWYDPSCCRKHLWHQTVAQGSASSQHCTVPSTSTYRYALWRHTQSCSDWCWVAWPNFRVGCWDWQIHHIAAYTHTSVADSTYCWCFTILLYNEESMFAVASWHPDQCAITRQPGLESWRLHTHCGAALRAIKHLYILCSKGMPTWTQSKTNYSTTSTPTWSWWTFHRCWSCTTSRWRSHIAASERFWCRTTPGDMDQAPNHCHHSEFWWMC